VPGRRLSARERLIVALDVPDAGAAAALASLLAGEVGCFKVGLELFVKEGPDVVEAVSRFGKVFLDLKLHDIPATVEGAAAALPRGAVGLLTVHAGAGEEALRRAVRAAAPVEVVAVTLLTSLGAEDLAREGIALAPERLVEARALLARRAGCAGVVCSAREARIVRSACGDDFLIVTPGIRPAWEGVGADDQKRTAAPREALAEGADMIVVGRAIRRARDPVLAARRVVAEMEAADD